MFAPSQLNELAERRRLLALEAELHRSVIRLECLNMRERFAGGLKTAANPLVLAGAAVAGLLLMRRGRKLAGLWSLLQIGLRLGKLFKG